MSKATEQSVGSALTGPDVIVQAKRASEIAADRAGVSVREVEEMDDLRSVSGLFESVWGRTPEGVPVNSEVLRSLAHAGGCVTAAFDGSGGLVGAASLALAEPAGSAYSLIAAVAAGTSDRGIGQAVKLRQRAWALGRGHDTLVWTFDPLVSRNARFNTFKLGATAHEYAVGFYGVMSDRINGADEADRLVAQWDLASGRAVAASEGLATDYPGPSDAVRVADAPDGGALLVRDSVGLWVRVPADIVELRRGDARLAEQWRRAVREALVEAFGQSLVATHMTRQSWYLLEHRSDA